VIGLVLKKIQTTNLSYGRHKQENYFQNAKWYEKWKLDEK
jgi:hypothetical protein